MIFLRKKIFVPVAFFCTTLIAPGSTPDKSDAGNIIPVEDIAPEKTEKYASARTEYFALSSESPDAVKQAAELAREVETYFTKNPRLWKILLPPPGFRIQVELFSQDGIFGLRKNADNETTLFISENFSDESESRIMRIRLAQAMIFNLMPTDNPADVPAWISYAAAEESRIGSLPGRRIFLQKKSKTTPVIPPLSILDATEEQLSADRALQINAIWLLRAATKVFHFLDTKKTNEEKFEATFPHIFNDGKFNDETARKFWGTHFYRLIFNAPSGIDLPEESRQALDNALLFTLESNGEEIRLLAGDLVAHRLREEIRQSVADRLSQFSEHFRKVNPVWHNAFAEYGLFLEMFGNPDVDDETLVAQWDKAILARDDAITLGFDIRRALNSAQAKRP